MNAINEKINTNAITAICRELNPNELMSLLQSNQSIFWSWGASAFTIDNSKETKMFRMKVNGHHHKGHVYIFVNGMDLFDVYLTTLKGRIINKSPEMGLYFDQLVEWIDEKIEKISEYEF